MFASIDRVQPGFAKSFEDLNSGFKLRIVGDGEVDREIADRFQSSDFVEAADDRRLRNFLRQNESIRAQDLPRQDSEQALQDALAKTLGQGWSMSEIAYGAGNRMNTVTVSMHEAGVGQQKVYLNHYEKQPTVSLSTSYRDGGWSVTHRIEGSQTLENLVESAELQKQ
jgi:hypothetical protein